MENLNNEKRIFFLPHVREIQACMDVCGVWIYGYVLCIELTGGVGGIIELLFPLFFEYFSIFRLIFIIIRFMYEFIHLQLLFLIQLLFLLFYFMKFNIFYSVASVFCLLSLPQNNSMCKHTWVWFPWYNEQIWVEKIWIWENLLSIPN